MASTNAEALKLPDQLLVRYFRSGEIDSVRKVETREDNRYHVHLLLPDGAARSDYWRDLGGGLGYVPDQADD